MVTGYQAAKEMRDKVSHALPENKEAIEVLDEKAMGQVVSGDLADFYKQNASVGSEEISGGKLPLLKIHQTGKSKGELQDGSEPTNGFFYYSPTQEQFEKVEVHILSISRGYYAKPLEGSGKDKVFTQLMGGVIIDGKEYKPFIMYLTGLKLQPLWTFGREIIAPFTKNPRFPIPMFALIVELGSEKVDTKFGKSYIPTFKLKKNDKGQAVIVNDAGLSQYLLDSVSTVKDIMDKVISFGDISETDDAIPAVPPPGDAEAERVLGALT